MKKPRKKRGGMAERACKKRGGMGAGARFELFALSAGIFRAGAFTRKSRA